MISGRNDHIRLFILFLSLSFLFTTTFSQTPKGLIVTEKEAAPPGKTRALIVGISKYEYIDTLQYADRDAKMFADYLRQNNFWGINKDDITLLTNDKAKYGDLTVQLQRIAMVSKPGDNLLFYFSGHGDVETQTLFNRGYLLAYDTYSSNYMANGLRVDDLKDLFVTLLTNNVKVIVVTDACRSGKLAGGLKGAEFTAAAISSMWKNEIKILSSQPGQLSYEDKKWGNGRGVFSYNLINGLNGEADVNKDSSITLSELEMYVGSNVARETGNKQQPIFEGPNKFSNVIGKISREVAKAGGMPGGNSFDQPVKEIKLPYDSCLYYYEKMNVAIKEKKLSSLVPNSATTYYQQLRSCAKGEDIQFRANGELLSALMNESQEIINNSFVGKKLVGEDDFNFGIDMLQQFIDNNDLKLPHEKHILNLKRYLEVMGKTTWQNKPPVDKLELIIDSAIMQEPDAAYLLTAKGAVEMEKGNWEKAIDFFESALKSSPDWLIPKYQLGNCYGHTKSYKKALNYFEEVLAKDSTYRTFECTKCILQQMAEFATILKQEKKAVKYLLKSIDLFPDYTPPYDVLYEYATTKKDKVVASELVTRLKKYEDTAFLRLIRMRLENEVFGTPLSASALDSVKAILRTDSDTIEYYYIKGLFFGAKETFDSDSAYYYLQSAINMDTTDVYYIIGFTSFLLKEKLYDEAEEVLIRKIKDFTGEDKAYLQQELAYTYYDTYKYEEAFELFKELVSAGFLYCTNLRKMRKVLKDVPGYETYMKTCQDSDPAKQ